MENLSNPHNSNPDYQPIISIFRDADHEGILTLMKHRNIILAYILSYLRQSCFWLGIWVYYYLRFTNYAGIGLIESIMILTMTVGEIPTGAIADLLGKKELYRLHFFYNHREVS